MDACALILAGCAPDCLQMLFAVAVSYIFISVIATFRLSYVEQRWTRTANMNVDQVCDLLQAELDEEAERDPDAVRHAGTWYMIIQGVSKAPWCCAHLFGSLTCRELRACVASVYQRE